MQVITRETVKAFLEGFEKKKDNSEVKVTDDVAKYYLHGNCIARHNMSSGEIKIRHAGWRTHTTKNRLRGISKMLSYDYGVDAPMVFQREYKWYLGEKENPMKSGWNQLVDYEPPLIEKR